MRVLFMGTPDFAVGCLKALCENSFDVCGVVSQPDKPKGRGHKLQPTPVHEYADSMNIAVYQPEKIKNGELVEVLNETKPDVIIVVAYGKILPEYILNYPKYGCINVHASLLPKYRGAAPIQRCIIDGEKETGVTTMYMEKGLDTGDMILKKVIDIDEEETAATLHDKLMNLGAQVLIETLEMVKDGSVKAEKQDDAQSSYAPMIDKASALIDWQKSAREIANLVRGMNPYPFAYTYYNDKMMKIGQAQVIETQKNDACGKILGASKDGILVACGEGSLLIKMVQFEGKKMMSVRDYLAGHLVDADVILTSTRKED
ncbi:MAG: methionyl-tRNA formyltransferase [Ruminococcaceae bacterium]|nr:methionyl-tRNA formyltransferase [Oscillospiraceae bacterium]